MKKIEPSAAAPASPKCACGHFASEHAGDQNHAYECKIAECECAAFTTAEPLPQRIKTLADALRWLLNSIPHHEGDDNLTEPIAAACAALSQSEPLPQPEKYFATGYTREDLSAMHPKEKLIGVTVPGAVQDRLEQVGAALPQETPQPTYRTFTLSEKEEIQFKAFSQAHHHGPHSSLWIAFSNSSGIGTSCKASCQCGAEEDITDYDLW